MRESVRVVKVRVGFPQYVCHRELIWDKAPCRFHVEIPLSGRNPPMTDSPPVPTKRREIEVGDTVVYTSAFLHSIGQIASDMAHYRGTVRSIEVMDQMVMVKVGWTMDGMLVTEDELGTPWEPFVNIVNIARPLTARAMDVPLWASVRMGGGTVTASVREAIDEDNRKRRDVEAALVQSYMDRNQKAESSSGS